MPLNQPFLFSSLSATKSSLHLSFLRAASKPKTQRSIERDLPKPKTQNPNHCSSFFHCLRRELLCLLLSLPAEVGAAFAVLLSLSVGLPLSTPLFDRRVVKASTASLSSTEGEKPDCIITPKLNVGGKLRADASNGNTIVCHMPVSEYVTPEAFDKYREIGEEMGFQYVASGPMVRSSYKAAQPVLYNWRRYADSLLQV